MGRQEQVQLDDHKVLIMDLKARIEALEKAAPAKAPATEPDRETRKNVRGTARAGSDKLRDQVRAEAAKVREAEVAKSTYGYRVGKDKE